MYGLALGWEDLSDHGSLRCDVAMQTAVGVKREVASAPTLCRLEKWADQQTAWRLHQVLLEQFIASFKTAPEELVLDFDATDNPCTASRRGDSGFCRQRILNYCERAGVHLSDWRSHWASKKPQATMLSVAWW